MAQKFWKDRFLTGRNSDNPIPQMDQEEQAYGFPRFQNAKFTSKISFCSDRNAG